MAEPWLAAVQMNLLEKLMTKKHFMNASLAVRLRKNKATTRRMVPIPRRASSFLVVVFIHVNRKEEEEGETEQQQQFTKGCNILHRLQVYHLTLTFIIHNKYTSTLYLYTYMHIPIL